MREIEILAPAGNMESFNSAINAGADAVYIGGSRFSARAYAGNFDDDAVIKVIDASHLNGTKVYVALNILIKEKEINEALKYAEFLYKNGTDALIIQDMGIAKLIHEHFPDFELHASTQMTVHNKMGAEFLTNLGFKRIVLSRELSINEISDISKHIETEIFVHGALCVCYSGQCLMSSLIGGRSGNRGRCAQPCRKKYDILNSARNVLKSGYLLSPKDLCTLDVLSNILNSNVKSLKIEGRMKKPEYVAGTVRIYKRAIELIKNGNYKSSSDDIEELLKLFNREGFTKAYLMEKPGKSMMAYETPKNSGILLGETLKNNEVLLKTDLNLGDGIKFGESGFNVNRILKKGESVKSAVSGDKVEIFPKKYHMSDVLYKTYDIELMRKLSKFKSEPDLKKNKIDLIVKFKVGSSIELSGNILGNDLTVSGAVVQKALKRPFAQEKVISSINKTGNEHIQFNTVLFSEFEEGFLPVSEINEARREFLEKADNIVISHYKRECSKFNLNSDFNRHPLKPKEQLNLFLVTSFDQLKAVKKMGFKDIIIDVYNRKSEIRDISSISEFNVYLKIPNIIKEEFEKVKEYILKNINDISGIITANLGIINYFKGKTCIIGDYKLNLFNSSSFDFFKEELKLFPVSVELNKEEIESLMADTNLNGIMLMYGRIELMVSEYCPIGCILGGKDKKRQCERPCINDNFEIRDETGAEFKTQTDVFCRSHILNSAKLNLIAYMNELKYMSAFRFDFSDETYDETIDILRNIKGEGLRNISGKFTKGHYKRGVE